MSLYYKHRPSLHLKDNWLEETGFATVTPVTVIVELGRLILQAAEW
jgi:hypothetical protein